MRIFPVEESAPGRREGTLDDVRYIRWRQGLEVLHLKGP